MRETAPCSIRADPFQAVPYNQRGRRGASRSSPMVTILGAQENRQPLDREW